MKSKDQLNIKPRRELKKTSLASGVIMTPLFDRSSLVNIFNI